MKDILMWILVAIIFLLIKLAKMKENKKYYDTANGNLRNCF